ncbi:protein trichome birefringence-like 18 [Impatiens glandulifera]|uniref:protein trichome birefringence-like 18 n=1 Tax=Impatiens glandulifera TaxID=253017 RepID=UPI001FB08E3A|nr:protein trichome birefringence-like 18 [Impatiens glandulifera]
MSALRPSPAKEISGNPAPATEDCTKTMLRHFVHLAGVSSPSFVGLPELQKLKEQSNYSHGTTTTIHMSHHSVAAEKNLPCLWWNNFPFSQYNHLPVYGHNKSYSMELSCTMKESVLLPALFSRSDLVPRELQLHYEMVSETTEDDIVNPEIDDRFKFDPNECSIAHGKWVFNSSFKPLYSDTTCPYIDRQFSCVINGRPDSDYRHWEWQPDDCILPRFSPKHALEKLRGKRLMFVGDSLQRNQ